MKSLASLFIAVSLSVIGGLVYLALARDAGMVAWILAAVWSVALVLIPLVMVRSMSRN